MHHNSQSYAAWNTQGGEADHTDNQVRKEIVEKAEEKNV